MQTQLFVPVSTQASLPTYQSTQQATYVAPPTSYYIPSTVKNNTVEELKEDHKVVQLKTKGPTVESTERYKREIVWLEWERHYGKTHTLKAFRLCKDCANAYLINMEMKHDKNVATIDDMIAKYIWSMYDENAWKQFQASIDIMYSDDERDMIINRQIDFLREHEREHFIRVAKCRYTIIHSKPVDKSCCTFCTNNCENVPYISF